MEKYEFIKTVSTTTFLDPRFKKFGLGNEELVNNTERLLTEELSAMFSRHNHNLEIGDPRYREINIESCDNTDNETTDDILGHFDITATEFKTYSTPSSTSEIIIKQYMQLLL